MLGAIIGDIIGSIYEWDNLKTKDFEIFNSKSFFTDDSVMTCAVAQGLMNSNLNDEEDTRFQIIKQMLELGRQYPNCGYGGMFRQWLFDQNQAPYNSYGNGSAMRVSPVAWMSDDLEIVLRLAKNSAEVTHNHPDGIKGAQAVAAAIFMARQKKSINEIKDFIQKNYYILNFTLAEIRDTYEFDETCAGTVPQAIVAFIEAESFEDAIRNAISIGGDSDTLAAITGSIAEAYYGIPENLREMALAKLDDRLRRIVIDFEKH
ncbi:MAG: ADP-ribosylglycohydrolase [Peptococcaceae bacterium BICA1-8]|nr:MAG: ADP-ribosylglycohydrolase [Peptococcaceae bacterium BICA1-8]